MRRMMTMLLLLTLALSLTACKQDTVPNPTGWWETSQEETLCATWLLLNPDNTFWLNSEGMLRKGTWSLDGNTLKLAITDNIALQPDAPEGDPRIITYTLNQNMSVIDIGSGLHLYRADNDDVSGYWWAGSSSLHLMDSGLFIFQKHESLDLTTLDGGEYLTGRWTQEGLMITLHGEDGSVQTATAVIDPESDGADSMALHFDGVDYYQMVE